MNYLNLESLRALHLEMTSGCNAQCPMCSRNIFGGAPNPKLPKGEVSIDTIKSSFSKELLKQFHHVMFCGVYGDPIVAKDSFEAVAYFKESGVEQIWFHTNGSARPASWWKKIAPYFQGEEDQMVFSVDGLEDTNHLYRKGTHWPTIWRNMQAFTEAGGNARWDFLVFKHNEHQVKEAQRLAKEIGIRKFRVRKTSRFKRDSQTGETLPHYVADSLSNDVVMDVMEHGNKILKNQYAYTIEAPSIEEYQNKDLMENLPKIEESYGSFENYLDHAEIQCIYKEKFQRLYVDFESKLWPCCFLPGDIYSPHNKHQYRQDFHEKFLGKVDPNFNSLLHHTLKDILAHPWFSETLVDSWSRSLNDKKNPKLLKCARTCGHLYNPILSQTQDIRI
ncbi:MAG: hypothetical protein KDD61_06745 [Bdellovibrionales bacterium]|nr:hypothetical protein [Bdellovibrionales bacterium]